MISIIILNLGAKDITQQAVNSIKLFTKVEHEIIVINQGIPEEITGMDVLVDLDKNIGFPAGCNYGAKKAKGDFLSFFNNDMTLVEETYEALLESFSRIDKLGLLSPKILDSRPPIGLTTHWAVSSLGSTFPVNRIESGKEFFLSKGEYAYPFLVPREVFEKVEGFDEAYSPFNFEDVDFNAKLRKAGYKIAIRLDKTVNHIGGFSTKRLPDISATVARNKGYFREKWGGWIV